MKEYNQSRKNKKKFKQALVNLHFMLLKVDNPDKQVDSENFNKLWDSTKKRFNYARKVKDPFSVKCGFVLKNEEDKPVLRKSIEEIRQEFDEKLAKYEREHL